MSIQALYEQDFNSWLQTNIALLKASRFSELDVHHLVEELEDMGKKRCKRLIPKQSKLLLRK